MKKTFLDFEKDIEALDEKIDELRSMQESDPSMDIGEEVDRLEQKSAELLKQTYAELTPWQISQVARHPNRPYTLDYIRMMFSDFYELHGDRRYSDDPAIVGGLARLGGDPVMVIGHQKGRDIKSRTYRNFGMANPEGYRKALRLMKLAEKFGLPIITFVDTPGAYPGIDAEKHGQSEAIGRNLVELTHISVPVITTIIGEGGSGGALAIAVADSVLMLQYSTYSVISPEGCASILWKDAGRASEAANALALTADRLKELKLIDEIVLEPMGGAHRDPELMAKTLRKNLTDRMKYLRRFTPEKLIAQLPKRRRSAPRRSRPAMPRRPRRSLRRRRNAKPRQRPRLRRLLKRRKPRTPRKRSLRSPARRKRPARHRLKQRRRKRPIKHVPR